tara:strand:- start:7 stop:150 length:144 start_codon:yes stop_codon:yes gene_type:complete
MTPRPTWRLLPCGAGFPRTVNVNELLLVLELAECSVNGAVQESLSKF